MKKRLLHLHSSFNPGGKELRAVQLINAFGQDFAHSIVSGQPEALGAGKAIDPAITVEYPADFPSLVGSPNPWRLYKIAKAMQSYDLVLTYNWGAMDGVMAHRLFGGILSLPPLVHHEDGFNQDEVQRLKPHRNLYRRIAFARLNRLIVPSKKLKAIAIDVWKQPRRRVKRISNGINTAAYQAVLPETAVPGLTKQAGECWVGTLAGLRPIKNLPRLVRAFAHLPENWRLIIIGDGPERDTILAEAQRLHIASRVHLPGFVSDPSSVIGLFDLFALSSDSEQFPISVVEAMAAGLAVVAPNVGDVSAMLAHANQTFIAQPGDEAGLAAALVRLAEDTALCKSIGQANRTKALADYDEQIMINAYRNLYDAMIDRTIEL